MFSTEPPDDGGLFNSCSEESSLNNAFPLHCNGGSKTQGVTEAVHNKELLTALSTAEEYLCYKGRLDSKVTVFSVRSACSLVYIVEAFSGFLHFDLNTFIIPGF